MELSQEIQDILQKYRPQRLSMKSTKPEEEFINVEQMDFSNDQTWLVDSESVEDLSTFLKNDSEMAISSSDSDNTLSSSRKIFDSRTFTRPKKKLNRPSIEKYNEEYFADDIRTPITRKKSSLSDEIDRYMSISNTTIEDGMMEKPLHFDLSQPVTTSIFDKILANATEMDSFQNMSPPSLVNSMCSSTFTNLMENSYIKNDPVLREIRDADYSSVIYQEVEPPLYQSITESCSSINTEVAETFVRKTLNSLNCTFNKTNNGELNETVGHAENIDPNATYSALNGTYRKNKSLTQQVLNKTFDAPQIPNIRAKINATFEVQNSPEFMEVYEKERLQIENLEAGDVDEHNSTFSVTKQTHKNTFNRRDTREIKSTLNSTFNKCNNQDLGEQEKIMTPKIDNFMLDENQDEGLDYQSKRLSDEIDDFLSRKLINSYSKEHHSAESTDSLDRLSSISNCSRDSKRMAEVDAIVERQERSLQQVMSTPKPKLATSLNKLFENTHLSPIPALSIRNLSDSEVSSEEYSTVRSKFADQPAQRSFKSLNNLRFADGGNKQRSIHTIPSNSSNSETHRSDSTVIRRPASGLSGIQSNLRQGSKLTGSYSNLKTVNPNLKGSYTNLRPRSMVLPNIPPVTKMCDATSMRRLEDFKVPQVPSANVSREYVAREYVSAAHTNASANPNPNGTFVKPKVSSLPRPLAGTGIPRPASKIPGPRTSRLPLSKTKTTSRTNLNEGYY